MITNYSADEGGVSAVVRNLAEELRKDGHYIDILSTRGPNWTSRITALAKLFRVARQYDIIHVHGSSFLGFLVPFFTTMIGQIRNRPVVVTYHGWISKAAQWGSKSFTVRYVARYASIITTPIEASAQHLRRGPIPAIGIPNPMRTDNWNFKTRERLRPRYVSLKNARPPVLCIEAFKLVRQECPDATLSMCFHGATPEMLPEYADIEGLTLEGFVPRHMLPAILDDADIYVNTIAGDSFGYRHFEAMASGLAAVSVQNEALRCYAGPGTVAFSSAETPESLAAAMISVVKDQEAALARIARGREIVEGFTWNALRQVWSDVYDFATGRCESPPLRHQ